MQTFTILQTELAAQLGLSTPAGLKTLRAFRSSNLEKDRDYTSSAEGIRWTPEACQRLATSLGVPAVDFQKNAAPTPSSGPATAILRAWAPTKNHRILLAWLPTPEKPRPLVRADLLRVWVQDCNRFPRHALVPARHEKDDLWRHDRSVAAAAAPTP